MQYRRIPQMPRLRSLGKAGSCDPHSCTQLYPDSMQPENPATNLLSCHGAIDHKRFGNDLQQLESNVASPGVESSRLIRKLSTNHIKPRSANFIQNGVQVIEWNHELIWEGLITSGPGRKYCFPFIRARNGRIDRRELLEDKNE